MIQPTLRPTADAEGPDTRNPAHDMSSMALSSRSGTALAMYVRRWDIAKYGARCRTAPVSPFQPELAGRGTGVGGAGGARAGECWWALAMIIRHLVVLAGEDGQGAQTGTAPAEATSDLWRLV